MMSAVVKLASSMDANALAAAALVLLGVFYTAGCVFTKLTRYLRDDKPANGCGLFPSVKTQKAELLGAVKCSTDNSLFLKPTQASNGDMSWSFSYDYYMPQGVQPTPHQPVRRSQAPRAAPQAPYFYPRKQQKSNVQIFSPTMSPNDRRYLEYQLEPSSFDNNLGYEQPHVQYIGDQCSMWNGDNVDGTHDGDIPVLDTDVNTSRGSVPPPPPPPGAASELLEQPQTMTAPPPGSHVNHSHVLPLESEPIDYPLLNDVLDVVYDQPYENQDLYIKQEYVAPPVVQQPLSSPDHSENEYMSPPYGVLNPTQGSVVVTTQVPIPPPATAPLTPESLNGASPGSQSPIERFVCPHCNADFRIKGYLTRHLKKHARQKAYTCPFYNPDSEHKCHTTGGFSRRDTYKTHLKTRHFVYPHNTPCNERSQVAGHCSGCHQKFVSNEAWIETHIQTQRCPYLD